MDKGLLDKGLLDKGLLDKGLLDKGDQPAVDRLYYFAGLALVPWPVKLFIMAWR